MFFYSFVLDLLIHFSNLMIIYLGTDHAGFALKEQVKAYLADQGHTVVDKGAYELHADDDYPDFIAPVAQAISENPNDAHGIIFGRSGQGEAMVANRFIAVRAAVYYGGPLEMVALERKHNNANVLSLAAQFISFDEAKAAIAIWLATDYEGGRHEARLRKMDGLPA